MAEKPLVGFPLSLHSHPQTAGRQFNLLVRNLVNTHDTLDRDHQHVLRSGYEWYDRAQEIAHKLGKGDVHRGAGVLAALSPQLSWERNVRAATEMFQSGSSSGRTGDQQTKARRIMEGESPSDVLKGFKETSFYHNISDPSDPNHVTIDRHAHDAAIGQIYGDSDRGLSAAQRYNIFHQAYNTASSQLGIAVPSRLQAGIWLPWSEGTRPS